jgi:hypothetical protein
VHAQRSVKRHRPAVIRTRQSIALPVAVVADPPSPPADQTDATVPTHVETWAYDDGCNGGAGASPAFVGEWLTYAESSCGPDATKAVSDCHPAGATACTALQYLDTNKIYSRDSAPIARDAQESWWLHQPGHSDAAHRVSLSGYGGGNILNQSNPAVRSWFHNYVSANFNSYDGLMMDDTSSSVPDELWGTGVSSSQELSTNSALDAAHEQMAATMTHTDGKPFLQVDNGLNVNPYLPTPFHMLDESSGVVGFVAENAPIANGTLTRYYSTLLDDMSYVDSRSQAFLTLLSYDSSGSLKARRVQAATVLLGYSPGHIVSWSDLEQNNPNLAVWPEEGIYPTQPVQTMATPGGSGCLAGTGKICTSGGHNDVQVAPGVFRREFKSCYNHGVAIGPCAAIVNDTGSDVTIKREWLTQSYQHEITMVGGDVQSGGTVDIAGGAFSAGSTSVPADDAALLS